MRGATLLGAGLVGAGGDLIWQPAVSLKALVGAADNEFAFAAKVWSLETGTPYKGKILVR